MKVIGGSGKRRVYEPPIFRTIIIIIVIHFPVWIKTGSTPEMIYSTGIRTALSIS